MSIRSLFFVFFCFFVSPIESSGDARLAKIAFSLYLSAFIGLPFFLPLGAAPKSVFPDVFELRESSKERCFLCFERKLEINGRARKKSVCLRGHVLS